MFFSHLSVQERDIDAEIMSRQTTSPLASTVEQSPSIESSLGSIPDTSRTDPGPSEANSHAEEHKKRQQVDSHLDWDMRDIVGYVLCP